MSEQLILCVECLRIVVNEQYNPICEPPYNQPGQNQINGFNYPTKAQYCVDGTYYCALHALPVYTAAPTHVIEEAV